MVRKVALLMVCMLLGFGGSQIILAEEGILLFGPEIFTRAKGKPITDKFNQTVSSISVPVVLANGENKIEVELMSKPGAFISIDITAPDVTIGPEGGTVSTTAGTRIEIPPGALTEDTVITIETLTEETLPTLVPEGLEFLGAADFQPDGLIFNKFGSPLPKIPIDGITCLPPATIQIVKSLHSTHKLHLESLFKLLQQDIYNI